MPAPVNPEENQQKQNSSVENEAQWRLLSLYADGETTPAEAAKAEALLCADPAWAQELALLQRMSAAVKTLQEVEPPVTLRASIYAATSARPTLVRRLRTALRGAFALNPARLAVAGGVCVAGVLLWLQGPWRKAGPTAKPTGAHIAQLPPDSYNGPNRSPIRTAMAPKSNVRKAGMPAADTRHSLQEHPALVAVNTPHNSLGDSLYSPKTSVATNSARAHKLQTASYPEKRHAASAPALTQRIAASDTSQKQPAFSVQPNMDGLNQPGINVAVLMPMHTPGNATGDPLHSITPITAPGTPPAPVTVTQKPAVMQVRMGPVSEVPPPARRYLAAGSLQREMEARQLQMMQAAATMDGGQRHEATITLVAGRF